MTFPGAIFELMYGTKFIMEGDRLNEKDNVLIIINHRCRLDWMFYWMAILRSGRLHNEKIIMKNELKHAPGPGWCMQYLLYCFLQRKWESDKIYLERYVNYFIDVNYPLQFFLFPEGTDLCKSSKAKSDRFAEKNGLPKYEHVLHPRTTGFNFLVQKTRDNIIDRLYDVTIGYPVNLCYGEFDLVKGNWPKEVHLHFKTYNMKDLPSDDESLSDWCAKRWAEKEDRLKCFYQASKFDSESFAVSELQDQHATIINVFSLFFWVCFVLGCIYLSYTSTIFLVYTIIVSITHAGISAYKGMDGIFLDLHEKEKQKKN